MKWLVSVDGICHELLVLKYHVLLLDVHWYCHHTCITQYYRSGEQRNKIKNSESKRCTFHKAVRRLYLQHSQPMKKGILQLFFPSFFFFTFFHKKKAIKYIKTYIQCVTVRTEQSVIDWIVFCKPDSDGYSMPLLVLTEQKWCHNSQINRGGQRRCTKGTVRTIHGHRAWPLPWGHAHRVRG